MKNKIIIGLFAMVLAYGCSTKKSTVTDDSEVKEALGINNKTESSVNEMVETINKKPIITTETLAEGKNLYGMNCAKCHKLYDSKDFTAEEWTPIVMRMQKKARISDEQREKIYAYLTTSQM